MVVPGIHGARVDDAFLVDPLQQEVAISQKLIALRVDFARVPQRLESNFFDQGLARRSPARLRREYRAGSLKRVPFDVDRRDDVAFDSDLILPYAERASLWHPVGDELCKWLSVLAGKHPRPVMTMVICHEQNFPVSEHRQAHS
jgi:hypothetical protein